MTHPTPPWRRTPLALAAVATLAALASPLATAQSASPVTQVAQITTLPSVEIIGSTPLPGVGVPKNQVPANV